MTTESLVETVKEKVGLVRAHAPGVVQAGVETLRAAREVVKGARREATDMLSRTGGELKKTLAGGADQVRHRLRYLATPTHKERAEARKAALKSKKKENARVKAKMEAAPDVAPETAPEAEIQDPPQVARLSQ